MLVVSDSSPFIGLIKIQLVDILPKLYGAVVIPPEVARELAGPKRPDAVRQFIAAPPTWISVRTPKTIEAIPGLDAGELAAISLACELKAHLLLIDEIRGRQAAIERNVPTVRTAAVLYEAANANFLPDLKKAFERLEITNFRVPRQALDELLRQHELFKLQITSQNRADSNAAKN